jgi:hypothetical protein
MTYPLLLKAIDSSEGMCYIHALSLLYRRSHCFLTLQITAKVQEAGLEGIRNGMDIRFTHDCKHENEHALQASSCVDD